MKVLSSVLGGIGLGIVAALFTLGACGGDKSAPGGTGGTNASAGGGSNGGSTSASSSAGGITSNAGASATGGAACKPTAVPDNGTITNFSEVTEGTSFGYSGGATTATNISWGTSTTLTGGTFFYVPNESDGVTPIASDGISASITGGAAVLTASIAVGDYTGFGLYFGPDSGSDATAFTGISFTILGALGGSSMDIQLQTNNDYPITPPSSTGKCPKGGCVWDTPDASAGKWSICSNPHTAIGVTVSSTVQTVQLSWDKFVGGKPVSALDQSGLLGLQFQFNCSSTATAPCTPNVTIDDLMFYH